MGAEMLLFIYWEWKINLKIGMISDGLTTPDLLVKCHVNVNIEENKLQGSMKKAWGKATEHVTRIKKQTRICEKIKISNRKHLTKT